MRKLLEKFWTSVMSVFVRSYSCSHLQENTTTKRGSTRKDKKKRRKTDKMTSENNDEEIESTSSSFVKKGAGDGSHSSSKGCDHAAAPNTSIGSVASRSSTNSTTTTTTTEAADKKPEKPKKVSKNGCDYPFRGSEHALSLKNNVLCHFHVAS